MAAFEKTDWHALGVFRSSPQGHRFGWLKSIIAVDSGEDGGPRAFLSWDQGDLAIPASAAERLKGPESGIPPR